MKLKDQREICSDEQDESNKNNNNSYQIESKKKIRKLKLKMNYLIKKAMKKMNTKIYNKSKKILLIISKFLKPQFLNFVIIIINNK